MILNDLGAGHEQFMISNFDFVRLSFLKFYVIEPHKNQSIWHSPNERRLFLKMYVISISALYGVLFESDEEAAFSNYRLWESLGFIFAYLLQINVCIDVKLWIVLAVLLSGMAGYLVIEVMESRKKKSAMVTPITSK